MEGKEEEKEEDASPHPSREERHMQRPCGKKDHTFNNNRKLHVQNRTAKGGSGQTMQALAVP